MMLYLRVDGLKHGLEGGAKQIPCGNDRKKGKAAGSVYERHNRTVTNLVRSLVWVSRELEVCRFILSSASVPDLTLTLKWRTMMNNGASLSERLRACYSGAVYDVLRAKGLHDQALPPSIRPININDTIAGPVFTIEGRRDDSLDPHQSLLKWCELLSKAPADTILICQPNDQTVSHMGELSSETLAYKKVIGYIVDGGCRDSAFIERLGFPVFCRYFTPVDIVGKWAATSFEQPIAIGCVTIRSGDYALADRDGIVIIPGAMAEEVVEQTEEVLRTENLVRKAILQGVDPVEAYLAYGKF